MSRLTLASTVTFEESGWTVLPELVAGDRLFRVRPLVDAALSRPTEVACERPNNTLVPLRWDDAILAEVAGELERVADLLEANSLRFVSAYLSVKEPLSPPLWWHQDWWCWTHPATLRPGPTQVAVLCYLQDTDARSGALRVIPGSHRRSLSLHALLPAAHPEAVNVLDLDHPAMSDHPDQVTLGVRAGDAVVTDYRLLHGTHPNAIDRRRDCLLLSFVPEWDELDSDLKGHVIQLPALPGSDESVPPGHPMAAYLPTYDGERRDLPLVREAPASFGWA